MLSNNPNEFIWSQKYRPNTIKEVILPKQLKKIFNNIVESGQVQNLILSGPPGIGKSTTALAVCKDLGVEYLFINASNQRNIDLIRETLPEFVSTISLSAINPTKVVILDEGDNLNAESAQPALRAFIEEHSANCRFIITANYLNRLIEPIRSRFEIIEFSPSEFNTQAFFGSLYERIAHILENEGVKFDPKSVAKFIIKFTPDLRVILNKLQFFVGKEGEINRHILYEIDDAKIEELFSILKVSDFQKMRVWVAENISLGNNKLFTLLYESLEKYVSPGVGLASAIHILGHYQYTGTIVPDKQLNLAACLADIMIDGNIQFI